MKLVTNNPPTASQPETERATLDAKRDLDRAVLRLNFSDSPLATMREYDVACLLRTAAEMLASPCRGLHDSQVRLGIMNLLQGCHDTLCQFWFPQD